MAETELSVVCKSCGSEVSPYVTECPYCGTRLRRRAPKLEREGDEIKVRETVRARRRRRAAERRAARGERGFGLALGRPYATAAAILGPALLMVLIRADVLTELEAGAIVGPVDSEWWRYLAAPFVYDDMGYLFACGLAIAIFGIGVEARVGTIATALLVIACGSLGMLAAEGLDTALADGFPVASGGNGAALGLLAAWAMRDVLGRRRSLEDDSDLLGALAIAAILILLPLASEDASALAGLGGGVAGVILGVLLARIPER